MNILEEIIQMIECVSRKNILADTNLELVLDSLAVAVLWNMVTERYKINDFDLYHPSERLKTPQEIANEVERKIKDQCATARR